MFENLFARKGLSLDKLRTLVEVADAGGIAAAATRNGGRNASRHREGLMSRQLKELSGFFGAELTQRHGRGLRLTPVGQELARHARLHFQALSALAGRAAGRPAPVSLGAGDSLLHWLVIPRLGRLTRRVPGLLVELRDLRTHEVQGRLADLSLDFGLLRGDAVRTPVRSVSLGTLEYVLLVPKRLFPKQRSAPSLEVALRDAPLATQGGGTLFQRTLEEQAADSGLRLNVRLQCETFPEVACAVQGGEFAGILPALGWDNLETEACWQLPLPWLKSATRPIHLAWNPRLAQVRAELEPVRKALETELRF